VPESSGGTPQAGNLSNPEPLSPPIALTPEPIHQQLDSLARVNSGITSLGRDGHKFFEYQATTNIEMFLQAESLKTYVVRLS